MKKRKSSKHTKIHLHLIHTNTRYQKDGYSLFQLSTLEQHRKKKNENDPLLNNEFYDKKMFRAKAFSYNL